MPETEAPPGGDCCRLAPGSGPAAGTACPDCGQPGRRIDAVTPRALLRPPALAGLSGAALRFCRTPACPVVYFGDAERFTRGDLSVPVFQKESADCRIVCYCFGVTEADVRRELEADGLSRAAERITRLVRLGRCACELRNPQGSCCLGNVSELAAREVGRAAK